MQKTFPWPQSFDPSSLPNPFAVTMPATLYVTFTECQAQRALPSDILLLVSFSEEEIESERGQAVQLESQP